MRWRSFRRTGDKLELVCFGSPVEQRDEAALRFLRERLGDSAGFQLDACASHGEQEDIGVDHDRDRFACLRSAGFDLPHVHAGHCHPKPRSYASVYARDRIWQRSHLDSTHARARVLALKISLLASDTVLAGRGCEIAGIFSRHAGGVRRAVQVSGYARNRSERLTTQARRSNSHYIAPSGGNPDAATEFGFLGRHVDLAFRRLSRHSGGVGGSQVDVACVRDDLRPCDRRARAAGGSSAAVPASGDDYRNRR